MANFEVFLWTINLTSHPKFLKSVKSRSCWGDQCDEVPVTLEQKLPELSCFG